ncbi:MAG: Hypoxic response protein 1 [Acidobacteria bacterium ADurb.Bin340]|nr:MAG: Hypoxic response protein 1 [Acidobacteria bacterium ADurb.Bin340]
MKTIQHLLAAGRRAPIAVGPDDTVLRALMLMSEEDIGALLVVEDGRLVGIFSERDYARKVVLRGRASRDTRVRDIMSDRVFYLTPERTVEEGMALMTDKRIRHLPVLNAEGEVLGLVSIGDLVKETISHQAFLIDQLERYITG